MPWFLQQLEQYYAATGVQLVDVLDNHYYPNLPSDSSTPANRAPVLRGGALVVGSKQSSTGGGLMRQAPFSDEHSLLLTPASCALEPPIQLAVSRPRP